MSVSYWLPHEVQIHTIYMKTHRQNLSVSEKGEKLPYTPHRILIFLPSYLLLSILSLSLNPFKSLQNPNPNCVSVVSLEGGVKLVF